MKNKSARHKSDNTFKFIPFVERINSIDVDIFHKVAHEYETQLEEDECIFHQTIGKWNVLNLTKYYDDFKRDLHGLNFITLPQLIFNKESIKNALLKHLELKNELALQPLLDLVVALAKDLRQDFYPYYHDFFKVLVKLLHTNNSELLEWTFHCLAYLYKFLWRPMIADIGAVFRGLLPLLREDYPVYINNFAAESFAFVARKVRDFKSFLFFILKNVKHHKDGISGCGRLLYEVVKGITGDFHSTASNILQTLFTALEDDTHRTVLNEVLEKLIEFITSTINPQKSEPFFNVIISSLNSQLSNFSKCQTSNPNLETFNLTLILLGQSLEYKSGRFLNASTSLVTKEIHQFLRGDYNFPPTSVKSLVQIAIILLQSSSVNLSQAEASGLVHAVLARTEEDILLFFVEHTFNYPLFKTAILPKFLNRCVETELRDDCLTLLTKLLLAKAPLCLNDNDLNAWTPYSIDFGVNGNEKIFEILKALVEVDVKTLDKYDKFMCALIILPHLKRLASVEEIKLIIYQWTLEILTWIQTIDKVNEDSLNQKFFLLILSLESFIHLADNETPDRLTVLRDFLLETLLGHVTSAKFVLALKSIDLFFTFISLQATSENILTEEVLLRIHEVLKDNLNSPHHRLRLYTTHIYSLFETALATTLSSPTTAWTLFSLCHKVESTRLGVDTYRDQLQCLEKLNYEKSLMQHVRSTPYADVALRYLCGVLCINFKLLWEPTITLIASHAHGMPIDQFWRIYVEELRRAAVNMRTPPIVYECTELLQNDKVLLIELYQKSARVEDKTDYANYRLLLWRAMTNFARIAEARNRDTVDLFLHFINDEYMKINSDVAFVLNIKQSNSDLDGDDTMEVEEVDNTATPEETETEEFKRKLRTAPVVKSGGKVVLKLLLHHLQVFAKVVSPRSMFKEPELYRIYFEFLAHKNWEVQKAVLDCILTYKNKNVTPYSEHLYNLIDEKHLRNELVHFKLDKEATDIQPQHRQDVIPLILKIVYSKMVIRTGGKAGGQHRRNMIFRFLSGCMESEMLLFIKMAFKFYEKFDVNLGDDHNEVKVLIAQVLDTIDLENFIPPKRLQSTENLLMVVFEQFGNLMDASVLRYVLKIILCIGATLQGAFNVHTEIHAGYLNILRGLRTSSIKLVEQFFSRFDYKWSVEEIDAIFEVFIWPYIPKLQTEGIHSPTTLLKLLGFWASNPIYYQLLVKHHGDDQENYPLVHLMQLLGHPKLQLSVNNFIMEMFENMLRLTLDDGEMMIPAQNVRAVESSILERLQLPQSNLNYGSCILLPHVPQILRKMKEKLLKKRKVISRRDLIILSRISELVWEADISDSTLELLIPILVKRTKLGAKEEEILQFLTTVKNLMLKVQQPAKHLKAISPLFASVKDVPGRKILCEILKDLAIASEEYNLVNDLINELNSYNVKWLDQPDYDRRLAAFRRVEKLHEQNGLSLELSVLLIYNCFYTISAEKDLSMKESATECLKLIAPSMVQKHHVKHREYILDETLFPLIKSGFKPSSSIRTDCIALLGHLARQCPEAHVILSDLNKLTNKLDLEVDFFENLVHLQMHRQGRALLKVKDVLSKQPLAPNIRTMTQYLVPLAAYYLCNEVYLNKHALIDSACEVLSTCARLMPWHHYEALLKLYLGKLMYDVDNQKQLVKIVVCVLDAYHFDLRKGLDDEAMNSTQIEQDKPDEKKKPENIPADEAAPEEEQADDEDEEEDESDEEHTDEEEEEPQEETITVTAYDKTTVLCKSAAKRIIRIIKTILLPQLNRTLAMKTTHEQTHKLNAKKSTREEREDEDLVRIPITLAVVKLLQRLPRAILDRNLPGVIMKLCTFLKTKLESVRRTARETLQKIVLALGPDYLNVILAEMSGLQYKGFQMHVLVFTVHAILSVLKPHYARGHIDGVLLTVTEFCMQDLFGALADEREVAKLANKIAEASTPKSYDTLQILAQFITEKCIMDLLMPVKKILGTSHSLKVVNKAEECLKFIALGLIENPFIDVEVVLKFAYGTASESIPDLLYKEKTELTTEESQKLARQKPDCYIIPKAPVARSGVRPSKVRSSQTANAHLLVEFGLKLCNLLLKRDKLKDGDYKGYIDPFVYVLKNSITTPHVKLNTLSLQCMEWLLKYELPSLKSNIQEITTSLFVLLHKYASAGLKKGDNFDLVVACFKTLSVLVRDVKYHIIETDQLKVLLMYVEQDLYNHERQATAFGLLKAIIARKLIVPELHEIIKKVGELSITSEMPHVRQQCRIVYHHYIMDYPLGNKLNKYVAFYLGQLGYELQSGRESALDMLLILINSFPIKVLKTFDSTFFAAIGTRLTNDDVPACRKMAAKCLTTLLERLQKPDRDPLFDMLLLWMQDKKVLHKTLAAQMCGIFISVEGEQFESRISTLIPIVLKQFNKERDDQPGKFVRVQNEESGFIKERAKDHHLYQIFQMLLKLCVQCPKFLRRVEDIESLAVRAQSLLAYPHDWVRLAVAQFLGHVLGSLDIKKLETLLLQNQKDPQSGYLYADPNDAIKSLTLDLCAQLVPSGGTKPELAEQVIKNLIVIARVIQNAPVNHHQRKRAAAAAIAAADEDINNDQANANQDEDDINPETEDAEEEMEDGEEKQAMRVNLLWLIKRVRRIINLEIIADVRATTLRAALFKFIAAMLTVIDIALLRPILHHLMAPLVRELVTTEKSTDELLQLAREITAIVKTKVGNEAYAQLLLTTEAQLTKKRAERKRQRTQLAVTDPELYAKKKIKHNEKKRELKRKHVNLKKGRVWKKPVRKEDD